MIRNCSYILIYVSTYIHAQVPVDTTAIVEDDRYTYENIQAAVDRIVKDNDLSLDERFHQLTLLENDLTNNIHTISLGAAYIIHKKGVIKYRLGRAGDRNAYMEAKNHYWSAIELRSNFEKSVSLQIDIANGLNNLSGCYLQLGQPYQALDHLNRGLDIANELDIDPKVLILRLKLNLYAARTYRIVGDYKTSILYYDNIRALIANSSDYNSSTHFYHVSAYMESGSIKVNYLSDYSGGLSNLLRAKELINSDEYKSSVFIEASLYHNLGIAHKVLTNYKASVISYKKSIQINREYKNNLSLADNYLNLGVVFKHMKQWDSATSYLQAAGQIYTAYGEKDSWRDVFDNLGDIDFAQKAFQQALDNYNSALEIYFPDFDSSQELNPDLSRQVIADKQHVLVILSSKIKTFVELYHQTQDLNYLIKGWQTLGIADQLVTMLRSGFFSEASKINLAATVKPLYEQAISICWMLNELQPADSLMAHAFSYSEKSRSIVLLEAIKRAEANFELPEAVLNEEKLIIQKTNYYEKALALETESMGLEDSLLRYRRRLSTLRSQVKNDYPAYFSAIYEEKDMQPQSIQNSLDEDQSFVEYFIGGDDAYAFLIHKNSVTFQKIGRADSIKSWSESLIASLSQQDQSFLQPAYDLYKTLIAPFKSSHELNPSLIIVADDILGAVNLETLVNQVPKGRIYFPSFSNYLLLEHAISYTFSGSLFLAVDDQPSQERSLLAIAPAFSSAFSMDGIHFDPLSHNIDESQTLKTVYPKAEILSGSIDLGEALKQIPEHGILHLATHAKASSENGDLSYILFGDSEEKKYYTKDLYNLDLKADLIVLSACETAVGTLKKGEGIINIARGFLYAGASAVATSLWNVREESNSKIVLNFHKNLQRDLSKSKALQKAKQEYIASITKEKQHMAHPYFWAPIVLIGDDTPLPQESAISKWIILSILGFGGFFLIRGRQKKIAQ